MVLFNRLAWSFAVTGYAVVVGSLLLICACCWEELVHKLCSSFYLEIHRYAV